MALTTFYTPRWRAVDDNGDPLPNAVLEFFEAGTSTPLAVYADVDGNVSLGTSVTSDGSGLFAELFMLPQAYDINLLDEDGNTVWTAVDWLPPSSSAAGGGGDVTVALGENVSAGDLLYESDGAGGKNAGSWYKSDADLAYACAFPNLGFAVNDGTAGTSGTVRASGAIPLSGLVPGTTYYVSGTAGSVTSTAPAIARVVGQAQSATSLVIAIKPWTRPMLTPQGRLTLTTGVPVTTADVTAATTLYYAPYQGSQLPLYSTDSAKWYAAAFSQLSIAVPATTSQMYDVFVYDNAGTLTLELTAWTNDTTRATALTTQDGVYVKTGALNRLYLGSFRTTGVSGQTEDSATKRYLWNYYNRVKRSLQQNDTTGTWTYTTATWQQQRANAANQVEVVVGVAESLIDLTTRVMASNSAGSCNVQTAIGEDSTTAPISAATVGSVFQNGAGLFQNVTSHAEKYPAVGWHKYVILEASTATGTTTWYGANSTVAGSTNSTGTGIYGSIWG